jgi:hypothetical protein
MATISFELLVLVLLLLLPLLPLLVVSLLVSLPDGIEPRG